MATPAIIEPACLTRVLVFTVDDGCLCVDLDRVDTVYTRGEARVYTLKTAALAGRSFLIHRNEPALIVDLREAFGLSELLGVTERAAFMVMRAGSFPLAVPVDACVGVRDLDLQPRTPVPTALQRDGGFSVGHLVELDGRNYTLLEPSRILSSALRERLQPSLQEARAFCRREEEIAALVAGLRIEATLSGLRTYVRLARRNGRTRAAAAARAVLKATQESEQQLRDGVPISGDLAGGTLMRDLLTLATGQQTGEVRIDFADGGAGSIFLAAGRIADAEIAGTRGRPALMPLLAMHNGTYRFFASDIPVHPTRIEDATPWLLVEVGEQAHEARRGRHGR